MHDCDPPAGGALLYGRAKTLLAPVDLDTGAPRRLTSAEREILDLFLE